MENLRWILIAAGVAILVLLYFSGKPKRQMSGSRRHSSRSDDHDLGMDMGSHVAMRQGHGDDHDPLLGDEPLEDAYPAFHEAEADDFVRPGSSGRQPAGRQPAGRQPAHPSGRESAGMHPSELPPNGLPPNDFANGPAPGYGYEFEGLDTAGDKGKGISSGFSSFTQKFEAFGELLSPKRRKLVAQSEPADLDEQSVDDPRYANKIVTLHVVAPPDSLLAGDHLLDVFERRGYHYGELNIFHSMHEGNTVFSVAKMIEPGFFDINDMDSFQTPGITMILQLPGPVPADVAFEVLVNEAYEMARELGGAVLDEQHSTLTKQTVQHLREGIYEYMHRQKYFGTVPS